MSQTNEFGSLTSDARAAISFLRKVWRDFFKQASDEFSPSEARENTKQFFETANWNEVYDLIEFGAEVIPSSYSEGLVAKWNKLLEQENAGYRLIEGRVTDIVSQAEIAEIESALSSGIPAVREHIKSALVFLSDRKNPNYRNSIKESISAVESICRLIGGGKTLASALKILREKVGLHPALEKCFSAAYGYTSDQGGIRHALLEESTVDATDARFMLVTCSAFVNFVISKAATADLKLG